MGLSPFSPCPRRIWEGYKVCAPKGKTAEPSVLTLGQQVATYPQITQITQIFLDTGSANVWRPVAIVEPQRV